MYLSIPLAAIFPDSIALQTVALFCDTSPPAKTPSIFVILFSSIFISPFSSNSIPSFLISSLSGFNPIANIIESALIENSLFSISTTFSVDESVFIQLTFSISPLSTSTLKTLVLYIICTPSEIA